MVTLRFTKEECQILKVAMLDYQNGMEATGLPKNDPTEIGILRKICAGLGMELVIHKNGLHSEPKSPIKEEAK